MTSGVSSVSGMSAASSGQRGHQRSSAGLGLAAKALGDIGETSRRACARPGPWPDGDVRHVGRYQYFRRRCRNTWRRSASAASAEWRSSLARARCRRSREKPVRLEALVCEPSSRHAALKPLWLAHRVQWRCPTRWFPASIFHRASGDVGRSTDHASRYTRLSSVSRPRYSSSARSLHRRLFPTRDSR